MGEHLTEAGIFRSDKYRVSRADTGEDATDDKLVLSFHDPAARASLRLFAELSKDDALRFDIIERLRALGDATL